MRIGELCCGSAGISLRLQEAGAEMMFMLDKSKGPDGDLLVRRILNEVHARLAKKQIDLLFGAPPCDSGSPMIFWSGRESSRCAANPEGDGSIESEKMSNRLHDSVFELFWAADDADIAWFGELPNHNLMLKRKSAQKLKGMKGYLEAVRPACADGAPYRKSTKWFGTSPHLREIEAPCTCKKPHLWLQDSWPGADGHWHKACASASAYPTETCRNHVRALCRHLDTDRFRHVHLEVPRSWGKPYVEAWWPNEKQWHTIYHAQRKRMELVRERRRRQKDFDSTLGYPGEGPSPFVPGSTSPLLPFDVPRKKGLLLELSRLWKPGDKAERG